MGCHPGRRCVVRNDGPSLAARRPSGEEHADDDARQVPDRPIGAARGLTPPSPVRRRPVPLRTGRPGRMSYRRPIPVRRREMRAKSIGFADPGLSAVRIRPCRWSSEGRRRGTYGSPNPSENERMGHSARTSPIRNLS